jgi:hypothetical protein
VQATSIGRLVLAVCLLLPASAGCALPPTSPVGAAIAPSATATASAGVLLPANSVVYLEMVDSVSSATSKPGDLFKLRVAMPVQSGDTVLIPVDTAAVGLVVHAAKAGAGGKAGELIVVARYLDLPQGQVKLRSSFGAVGASRVGTSLGVALLAGPFAMMIKGKQVVLPAGTSLSARLALDTRFSAAP